MEPATVSRGVRLRATAALAAREIIRLTVHPLVVGGALASVVWAATPAVRDSPLMSYAPGTPLNVYNGLTLVPSLLLGPLTLFAANLLATRERRAGTGDVVGCVPTTARTRTLAALLAPIGPALLTAVLVAGQVQAYRVLGPSPSRWPTLAELATQPATVIGAGVLGVAVARWLPFPGAAAITMLLLGASYPAAVTLGQTTWLSFAPWRDLVIVDDTNRILSYFPGSVTWHVAYLLGLSAMAAVAALLATPGPRRALIGTGLLAILAVAGAGWAQLP
jgi:hypothetical protein